MAGESADAAARQARQKADQLLKRAELFEKGAAGERAVAELLAQLPAEWFVVSDIHWPGREKANIDHVVVGPTGVFVIDAKNWAGSVKVSQGVLRQNGYSRMKVVEGAVASSLALAELVPAIDSDGVVPVICFVGEGQAVGTVDGVELCTAETLLHRLQTRPRVISPELLQFLRFDLDMATRAATDPRRREAWVPPIRPDVRPYPGTPGVVASARRERSWSVPKRIGLGLLLWWIACVFSYYVLGSSFASRPGILGVGYVGAGIATLVAVIRRRQ